MDATPDATNAAVDTPMQEAMTLRPDSEHYWTLLDRKGAFRIVLDTDADPWVSYFADSNLQSIADTFARLATSMRMDTRMVLAVLVDHRINQITEDTVTGDESFEELWSKVRKIEPFVRNFVMLLAFSKHIDTSISFVPYVDLLSFVRRHTRGAIYRMATAQLELLTVSEITVAPRGWTCPICCEKRGESHMCHAFSCGHLVHYSCMLGMFSSECPICRTLD